MNPKQQEITLSIARDVRAGAVTMVAGAKLLNEQAGVNVRSARILIGVYLRLCEGKMFTFRPSEDDLKFLLSRILDSGQPSDCASALQSLQLHIAHREARGDSQVANRALLEQYQAQYEVGLSAVQVVGTGSAPADLRAIVSELNARAAAYEIRKLQSIRKRIKGKRRLPLSRGAIFHDDTIDPDGNWAFHYGGRTELQFNVGIEQIDGQRCLRFGVAFSLKPSQTLPDVALLYPNIRRFNAYLALYPEAFPGYLMWYWHGERSALYAEKRIRPEYIKQGPFIFFGRYLQWERYSPEQVLRTFDELLPLYEYVEGPPDAEPLQVHGQASFVFRPNEFTAVESTQYSQAQRVIDVSLRHMTIQSSLFRRLRETYGAENVCCETSSGAGTRVDVIVRSGQEFWFYEVKTGSTARACIREALGQLLEYAYWPGAQRATRLIVVGESPLDANAENYIASLRSQFRLPLEYEQQVLDGA